MLTLDPGVGFVSGCEAGRSRQGRVPSQCLASGLTAAVTLYSYAFRTSL